MKFFGVALASVKLVEKNVDLLEIPPDSGGCIFLDYDARTLRLRYLVTAPPHA